MPSSSDPVAELLAGLARALKPLELRWYVFGAQAAIVYGSRRLTADVDVTLELGGTPVSRLVTALDKRGFAPEIPDENFIELTRVIPLIHERSRIPVDLVLAGPGLEDLFFSRVRKKKLAGVEIPFASLEDLIAMKIISGRPKDLEDVEALLAVNEADLDITTVRETLALAEELLDQSDLLPALDGMARSKSAAKRAPRGVKRRPSRRKLR